MSAVNTQDLGFSYSVKRSMRRRTASIQIDSGEVQVRVPALTDDEWIAKWVASKAQWIRPRLVRQREALDEHQIDLDRGTVPVDGIHYELKRRALPGRQLVRLNSSEKTIDLDHSTAQTDSVCELVERRIKDQLKRYAAEQLVLKTKEVAAEIGLQPRSVVVRSYRRKWGQCTSSGDVSLNWRCIHLRDALQRYVIIHELCHLKEMNHSVKFWALVAQFCPNYLKYREEIRTFSPYLGW